MRRGLGLSGKLGGGAGGFGLRGTKGANTRNTFFLTRGGGVENKKEAAPAVGAGGGGLGGGPYRGAGGETEPYPAYPRRRTETDLQRVQRSHGRSRFGDRAALRAQKHDREPRPHRGDSAGKGADPPRALSAGRSDSRDYPRSRA